MFKKTKLTIPNNLEYLDIVFNYIDGITEKLGYESKDKSIIQLAVEECLNNLINYCFEKGEEKNIEIICDLIPNSFRISIKNQGMPFDPTLIPDYHAEDLMAEGEATGLSEFLMKRSMDMVNFVNLGKNGSEIQLIKYLPAKEIEQYGDFKKEKEAEQEEILTTDTFKEIRIIKPDQEAVEVSKCVYVSYGNSYVNEDVYYPERIKELNSDGRMTSIVAISEQGDIAGHVALFKPAEDAKITEWGMAVVKHAFRGQGIMNKLVIFAIDLAKQQGFDGIFAHCVTEHGYTQKVCHNYAFGDIALVIGYSPATVKYKQMSEDLSQRQTIVFSFKYFNKPEILNVFLPFHHKTMITDLYKGIGVEVKNQTLEELKIEERSIIDTEISSERNIGIITVHSYGQDFFDKLKIELKRLCLEKVEVIFVNLDLTDPATAVKCAEIESLGFFFCGIMPGDPFEHTLMLQYLNNVKIDFDKIVLQSEVAKKMMQYIETSV